MANQRAITLWEGDASPNDIIVRELPVADAPTGTVIYLYAFAASQNDILLRDPTEVPSAPPPSSAQPPRSMHYFRMRRAA